MELDGKIEDIVGITGSDMDLIIQMTNDNEGLFYDMMEDDEVNEKINDFVDGYVYQNLNGCE